MLVRGRRYNASMPIPAHQRRHVSPTNLMPFAPQPVRKLAGAVERQLQVQLIDPAHQPQIPLRQRPRRVVHARAAQSQKAAPGASPPPQPPRSIIACAQAGNFPSARPKKSRSTVSSPIFSCSSRIRSRPSARECVAAKDRGRVLQQLRPPARHLVGMYLVMRRNLGHCLFTPNRFQATRALNAAEWFRLGFLMDFAPPFTVRARHGIHL